MYGEKILTDVLPFRMESQDIQQTPGGYEKPDRESGHVAAVHTHGIP